MGHRHQLYVCSRPFIVLGTTLPTITSFVLIPFTYICCLVAPVCCWSYSPLPATSSYMRSNCTAAFGNGQIRSPYLTCLQVRHAHSVCMLDNYVSVCASAHVLPKVVQANHLAALALWFVTLWAGVSAHLVQFATMTCQAFLAWTCGCLQTLAATKCHNLPHGSVLGTCGLHTCLSTSACMHACLAVLHLRKAGRVAQWSWQYWCLYVPASTPQ